jgi:transaldolase / glucose-6-phosphate isomerase
MPTLTNTLTADLGAYAPAVDDTSSRMVRDDVMNRIWQADYTLWKPQPTEITNRLGWLTVAERMRPQLREIRAVADAVRAEGYAQALLMGMGGSSLAPDTFRRTFGVADGALDLAVLDSTDPDAVLAMQQRLDPARTLFIVSTKSGGTVETFSFFRYFYRWVVARLGPEVAGSHFIAITDPGSALADTAKQYKFRATFLNDPNIGGRYSAMSHFGLVPAVLIGADVDRLIDRNVAMSEDREASERLGAILGALAVEGRDKVTFVLSPGIAAFAQWVEQLIAESTGKEGRGILPVADEPLGPPSVYGNDRLFVHICLPGDTTHDAQLSALRAAGQPVVRIDVADPYDIGGEIFRWEMATAIAGWRLGINPFDQPNVEAAKVLARQMTTSYETSGTLPELTPSAEGDSLTVFEAVPSGESNVAMIVHAFLHEAKAGDYVAIQAYVAPSAATTAALAALRVAIRDHLQVATTVGYGPRFLHSTGQLHKGDGGHGVFLQIVTTPGTIVAIPDTADSNASRMTFGILKEAQALGDREALLNVKRRVLRVDPPVGPDGGEILGGVRQLMAMAS